MQGTSINNIRFNSPQKSALYKTILVVLLFFLNKTQALQLECDIQAPVAILINAETGHVLYEKNAHKPCFPASTTKVATALYALHLKYSELDRPVLISRNAIAAVPSYVRRQGTKHPSYRLEFGGTHMFLKGGELLPLNSLLSGLLLCSANDAANAIAEHVAGSVPCFMENLNAFLKTLGCKNTHFTNPHGLHDVRHVTSAFDLSIMARYAMRYPFFTDAVKATKYVRPKTNQQEPIPLVQSNALLKPGKFYYPYATGIKTGYTEAAKTNLVAAAEKNGRKLIAVVLNCEDSNLRYRSCIALFEKAFSEKLQERILLSSTFDNFSYSVKGGKSELKAALKEDVTVAFFPSEECQYTASLDWKLPKLPIDEDQEVGAIVVKDDVGKQVGYKLVYAKNRVEPTVAYKMHTALDVVLQGAIRNKLYITSMLGCVLLLLAGLWRRSFRVTKNRKM